MGAKRALIVDDSKSARLFLARVLEKYDIDVDSAESAEAAIDYLTSNRPDVIFMDHLMPGMDGLQAVQAIKNDPRTATIPIMMYTSQEGELYLGQARALGAVGVLPKQIKPTDVSKVLYQLHLVPDRRSGEQSSFTAVNVHVEGVPPELGQPAPSKALTETALREHFAELRRALVAGVDTQTDRITAEIRALLLEALPPQSPAAASLPEPAAPRAVPWPWVVACAALAIALLSTALWWRSERLLVALNVQVMQLREQQTPTAAALPLAAAAGAAAAGAAAAPAGVPGTAPAGDVRILPVPYGADALGGARLEFIRRLLYKLNGQKVAGVVDIRSFAGRFCLVGNALDGYSLAPDETAFAKCDVVGNPSDEALSAAQRTPLALANLIGEVRTSSHGALDVQVAVGDPANTVAPYPTPAAELTAGEWNRAAGANNRVEIRVR
ncbi:MAG TPA: response regulator [Steroidobacteraceae bacterium]|jgi:CheY-like chemotaxis protein|nr:response regulator [Steroidobacteraceae bacterium]